ncbi:flavin monoamine oxidase family protein [Brevibacillus sp. H7]|uniref:flavin monoamine oxidase family protein n=1 Tax=Brevibacillus sp. H7 TaxID=3349138 RepID=UPI0037F5E545
MISIIQKGLSKTKSPKNIMIVGAGMAGLVAASLLKEAGHHVKILEGNSRVGGRVFTMRTPFAEGAYVEAGAMRIPEMHDLVFEYIKKFGLTVNEFINATPDDLIYANGMKTRVKIYERHPDIFQYPVAPSEKGKTAEQLFNMAVQPIIDFINQDPARHWPIVERQLDQYSVYTFLRFYPYRPKVTFSEGAIEMMSVLLALEGVMEQSFLDILRDLMLFKPETRFYEITGGNDRLPYSFLPQLQEDILFHQRVTKITQQNDSVTLTFIDTNTSHEYSMTGDLAIMTIPFTVMQFVEVEPRDSFSHNKWRAIRELDYITATKIGIQFSSRFWEREGLYGGKTITDLPIRSTYYPSHGLGTPGPAAILASYTWQEDSMPWDGLTQEERIYFSLKNLATIHGDQVYREFQTGTSYSWGQDPFACGAVSFFRPGQRIALHPYIATPEGRVHFAGEHTTLTHGWIQGAIESGIRVAFEVNELPRL